MHDPKFLGDNIRQYRKLRGMTQAALAAKLYLSPQNISKWENGQSSPDINNLCLLCEALGVSVEHLLSGGDTGATVRVMIGIDGGGTKTEFCLFTEHGEILAREKLGGTNPNVYGLEAAQATLKQGIDAMLCVESEVCAIFAGIAGCGVESNRRAVLSFLKKNYPQLKIEVRNDAYNVIYSTPYYQKCMMTIMGTGSVVFVKTEKDFLRLGGWGYLFDNGFSGYAIGRDAVMAALAAEDGVGEPTVLFDMLKKELKGGIFESIPVLYKKPKEEIASYAKYVFRAYEQGDAVAGEILRERAAMLRHQIDRAAARYGLDSPIILAGGLTRDRDIVLGLLDNEHYSYVIPELPPIYGACHYCARMVGEVPEDFSDNFKNKYLNITKE